MPAQMTPWHRALAMATDYSQGSAPAMSASTPSGVSPGRIVFLGSPWPNGHAIARFRWTGWIVPDSGLWFDLHLESADYDAKDPEGTEEPEEDDSLGNWESKIVWNNYGSCIL